MPRVKEIPEYISATTLWGLLSPILNKISPKQEAECKEKYAVSRGEGHATRWYYKTVETLAYFDREPYICENGWLRSRTRNAQL